MPPPKVLISSKCDTWETPRDWFSALDLEFGFTLDPCCLHHTAKRRKHYTPAEDGLAQPWRNETVFMNPPYGRKIGAWMRKAMEESWHNLSLVVCFVPARVDTRWWRDSAARASEIRFPVGRVIGTNGGAWPFPLAIVIFRPRL